MRTNACHRPSDVTLGRFEVPPPPPAPSWGGLTRVDSLEGLSGDARARVHANNLRIREGDAERYAAYLEEYLLGARSRRTPAEILAYGPPADPLRGLEPGGSLSDEADLDHPYSDAVRAYGACTAELSDLIAAVEGRPVPLSVYFEASLTAKVEVGGRSLGGTLSSRSGASAEVGARAGPAGAATSGPGRAEVGVDAGLVGAKATIVDGRVEAVEVKARAVPGVAVHARRSAGGLEHSLSVGGKLGGGSGAALHVEGRVAVGVTLVTADLIRQALARDTYWTRKK